MQVTFSRIPDHEWGHVLIERDDRVVYRMHAGPITSALPHDLVHFTVEDALGIADGIWGAIAGGVVFRSMTHVSGRRPPHAEERSNELKRLHRDSLHHAELLGGLVESLVEKPGTDVASAAREMFKNAPAGAPSVDAIGTAVAALRRAEERWRALPVGASLVLPWPGHRRIGTLARRVAQDGRRQGRSNRNTVRSSTGR
jgi:hypothetical protein